MKSDLETSVIEGLKTGDGSIERALLAVSGLDEKGVGNYQQKLDRMQQDFEQWHAERQGWWRKIRNAVLEKTEHHQYETAKALFEYLWETKPNRYNDDFLLANVIDNQLDNDLNKRVGNCLGLTSLYSVLGARLSLEMAVLAEEGHILSLLSYDGQEIIVENAKRIGFDYNLKERQRFQKRDLIFLVSDTFNSRGNAKSNLRDFAGAIPDYDKAIKLKPDYAFAFNNRGVAKDDLGDLAGAMQDYDKAIELKPDYALAFYNRGIAKKNLGNLAGAMRDYDKAIELKPDYALAFNNRGIAKINLGDVEGARRDFKKAHELDPSLCKYSSHHRSEIRKV